MSQSQSDGVVDEDSNQINPISCRQCREAKRKCDRRLPSCSRCYESGFSCDMEKKSRETRQGRSALNRNQEKCYKRVTQEIVVSECLNRITSCMASDLVQGCLLIPELQTKRKTEPDLEQLENYVHSKVKQASSRLPSPELLESIHRAAGFHKKTAIGDSVFNFLDGSALIAFALLAEEFLLDAQSKLDFEDEGE